MCQAPHTTRSCPSVLSPAVVPPFLQTFFFSSFHLFARNATPQSEIEGGEVVLKVRVAETVVPTPRDAEGSFTVRAVGAGNPGADIELRAAAKPTRGKTAATMRDSWVRFLRRTPRPKPARERVDPPPAAAAAQVASPSRSPSPPSYDPPAAAPSLQSSPLRATPNRQRGDGASVHSMDVLPRPLSASSVTAAAAAADAETEMHYDAPPKTPPRSRLRASVAQAEVLTPPATAPRPGTGPEPAVRGELRRTHSDESLDLQGAAAATTARSALAVIRRKTRVGVELQPVLLGEAAREWHREHPDEPIATVSKKWRNSQHQSHLILHQHSRSVVQFKVNEMGEIIYKSHPSWVLMHQMQIGIRHCVARERITEEVAELLRTSGYWHKPEFYVTPSTIRFPAAGSEETVRHALGDFKCVIVVIAHFPFFVSRLGLTDIQIFQGV